MIRLSGIRKHFPTRHSEIRAVDGVNLTVEPGEIFGVIGYSGAGKSTLIRTINLLEPPTEGKVIVGDRVLTELSARDLRLARQEIGMIFQQFNLLWSRTVAENVRFPLEIAGLDKQTAADKVQHLLEVVGLSDRRDAYPAQLSGGQKQRVGIARALAGDPKVLLCDEATSALDPKTTEDILQLLQKINRQFGLTIVLITHEMDVIRKICHRVAVMDHGKIVESGPVAALFRRPQTAITRQFVQESVGAQGADESLDVLLEEVTAGAILKCTFPGSGATQPVISRCIRECDVDLNILAGQLHRVQGASYGTLYVQLDAPEELLARVVRYLRDSDIEVEVVKRGTPA
ncbi:methionine ABC transporter ATP-binding protein [Numidum massiliense]|uniref:methionine ABC transporter ATP-binding protein n=1 Tax=Numidum massiliense TaxID=1522315 RepID=UPI0006D54729|nr:methionine ABC transporter ATP-binding protein [Numidum massiliense]